MTGANPSRGTLWAAMERISTGLALTGGIGLIALIVMSVVSIVGRKLFASPIQGDIELMQIGSAICASAFLPYCEMRGANIKVDAVTDWLSPSTRSSLDALAHLVMAAMAGLLTWRTALHAAEIWHSGEETMLLTIPLWLPMALLVPNLALFGVAASLRTADAAWQARGARPWAGLLPD